MHTFKPTFDFKAYRIRNVDIEDKSDGLALFTVTCSAVRNPKETHQFEFIAGGGFPSLRFSAFVRAAGVDYEINDADELVGRYLAIKNNGKEANDFSSLEYAAACRQCDIDRWRDGRIYAAQCAAEEAAVDFADAA
jgi:hypothetical protein